jgi:hypothetical protein
MPFLKALVSLRCSARELRTDTDTAALARTIEVTLLGSFLAWTIHREGPAARRMRKDLDAALRPHLRRHRAAPKSK